jgi:hypothetical protein
MKRCHYKISLRIRHPALDPADMTSALGINPSRFWRVGERRHTPKGDLLEGIYRENYWTARLAEGHWPDQDLATAIGNLLNPLAVHRDFFHRIRSEGGRTELFVGWFFDGQSGGLFSSDLLARFADLKVDLSLDVYPPD